tara:strand:- start:112 stop:837 length:726 start_codon:yes stop_codon:yes gene_type:complete
MLKTRCSDLDTIQIGIDEAGRGPLFGRVYASAVVLPDLIPPTFKVIKDSKKFSSHNRLKDAAELIKAGCEATGIGYCTCQEIDELNIRRATHLAMHRAVRDLQTNAGYSDKDLSTRCTLLVDGNDFQPLTLFCEGDIVEVPSLCVPQGDASYMQIAAASILAKTQRDNYIDELVQANPDLHHKYKISNNKGYGTKDHISGIETYGITKWHRKTFGPCHCSTPNIRSNDVNVRCCDAPEGGE